MVTSVTKGANIQASEYNDLVGRISDVLGTGSGDSGYGQSVSSSTVTAEVSTVTAAQMDNLRTDMAKAYTHQTGDAVTVGNIQGNSNVSTVNANVMQNGTKYRITSVGTSDFTLVGATANTVGHIFTATGPTAGTGTVTTLADIIGADASGLTVTFDGSGTPTIDNPVANKGFNDYFDLMDTLETNRLTVDADSLDDDDAIDQDTRTSNWGRTVPNIDLNFTVTFTSENARRFFFNSGGEIWISGSVSSGNAKSQDWNAMLSNPGIVAFGSHYTRITNVGASGVTVEGAVGNYEISSGFTTIFEKEGNSTVYAENRYRIQARRQSATTLEFRVQLEDNDTGDRPDPSPPPPFGPLVDEDVDGDLTIYIGGRRANGTVVNPFPAYQITNTLE